MFGRSWAGQRALGGGRDLVLRLTNRIESPERAAQAAAGIAYGARSPVVTITSADGLPLAAEKKRSTAAASLVRVLAAQTGRA